MGRARSDSPSASSTLSPTTPRLAARWSVSGGRSARAASTTWPLELATRYPGPALGLYRQALPQGTAFRPRRSLPCPGLQRRRRADRAPHRRRPREALVVRTSRRVRRDGTVSVGGIDWEVDAGYLAGRHVTVARTLFEPKAAPWIEEGDRRHALSPVDPVANATRPRKPRKQSPRSVDAIPFDPTGPLTDQLLRRKAPPKGGSR